MSKKWNYEYTIQQVSNGYAAEKRTYKNDMYQSKDEFVFTDINDVADWLIDQSGGA